MNVQTEYILKLIDILSERTGHPKDFYGFRKMSETIDDEDVDVSPRYLDDLYRKVNEKYNEGAESYRASGPHLDAIAQAMGYLNFQQFCTTCDQQISAELEACTGNWWSYFKPPQSGEYIVKSPVKIFRDQSKQSILMDIKGRERIYSGKIDERDGGMTSFVESGTDRRINLVFKLGEGNQIELMQGVFCCITSMGDSISGKEICVREPAMRFEDMNWSRHLLNDENIDARIRNFFSEYGQNYNRINSVTGLK